LMRESSYPIGTMDYQAREEKNHFMSIAWFTPSTHLSFQIVTNFSHSVSVSVL
jgi:hypothetical protein